MRSTKVKYLDANIHLPIESEFQNMIEQDLSLAGEELLERYEEVVSNQIQGFKGGNVMLFNQNISVEDIESLKTLAMEGKTHVMFTLLASKKRISSYQELKTLKASGIDAIKFHSYQQEIKSKEYGDYITIAEWAESLNISIWIDCSYGSSKMLEYDNIELLISIASKVKKVPIIALHSGGARVIETLLIAESFDNILLDTSLTLPYYIGSSVESDLAFTYKKIGGNRVIYGSDQPYLKQRESLMMTLSFLEKYNFDGHSIENIMYNNLHKLIRKG